VRIELLAHKKGIKDHLHDSLNISDGDLPSVRLAEMNTQEGPDEESGNDGEVDGLGT
jgi:hypothetical protein